MKTIPAPPHELKLTECVPHSVLAAAALVFQSPNQLTRLLLTDAHCQTTNSALWDSQSLREGRDKDAYIAGIKACPQLERQKGDRNMCIHLGSLNHSTKDRKDSRSSFKVEMNWLKSISVLMKGGCISIPCNIHQLCYAKKEERKMPPLIHARPATPIPSSKNLHIDDLDRVNP